MSDDFDYLYWKDAIQTYPMIFPKAGSLKHELNINRDQWRLDGVILEQGTGEIRRRVLISPTRYIAFLRKQTKSRAA